MSRCRNETDEGDVGGLDAAADDRATFEDEAAVARFSEVARGEEAVVASTCDDDIELIWHIGP